MTKKFVSPHERQIHTAASSQCFVGPLLLLGIKVLQQQKIPDNSADKKRVW
jgi:hypothetical protein